MGAGSTYPVGAIRAPARHGGPGGLGTGPSCSQWPPRCVAASAAPQAWQGARESSFPIEFNSFPSPYHSSAHALTSPFTFLAHDSPPPPGRAGRARPAHHEVALAAGYTMGLSPSPWRPWGPRNRGERRAALVLLTLQPAPAALLARLLARRRARAQETIPGPVATNSTKWGTGPVSVCMAVSRFFENPIQIIFAEK